MRGGLNLLRTPRLRWKPQNPAPRAEYRALPPSASAAHSFSHSPRQKIRMETCGRGRGRQRAVLRALGGILGLPAQSARMEEVQATTHAARAKSGHGAKMSSSRFVDTHKTRDKVGFALVFFGGGQRKPMRFRHSARFARVQGEVRKIQKPKIFGGGFLGGKCRCRIQIQIHKGVLVPPTQYAHEVVHPSPFLRNIVKRRGWLPHAMRYTTFV